MVGKKGMSPIIATILLIAFAVALGAMIMNWSSSLVAGGAQEALCQEVKVKMRQHLCYTDNRVKVNLVNNGQTEIAAMILRIQSDEADQSIQIKNSGMKTGATLVREVPAVKPDNFEAHLIPMINAGEGEEPEACGKIIHNTTELPPCQ